VLGLESGRWTELRHAYGSAADIPLLLEQLSTFPTCDDDRTEPYFSLWSSLCHQGDVYTASYAAVPHLIAIFASDPKSAPLDCLLLATSIEIARADRRGPEVPGDLLPSYEAALDQMRQLAARRAEHRLDHDDCGIVAAVIATSSGHPDLAKAMLELSPDVVPEFMEWLFNR
jgi:hypothetical protein